MTNATQRLASLHDAREAFFKALKNHEHAVYQIGYEDGFSAGWDAALNRLSEARPHSAPRSAQPPLHAPAHPAPSPAPAHAQRDIAQVIHSRQEETPARDTLLSIIAHSPGLLRQEIVASARERTSTLTERTVRTALHRMKSAGELLVEDNRWYLAAKQKSGSGAGQSAG